MLKAVLFLKKSNCSQNFIAYLSSISGTEWKNRSIFLTPQKWLFWHKLSSMDLRECILAIFGSPGPLGGSRGVWGGQGGSRGPKIVTFWEPYLGSQMWNFGLYELKTLENTTRKSFGPRRPPMTLPLPSPQGVLGVQNWPKCIPSSPIMMINAIKLTSWGWNMLTYFFSLGIYHWRLASISVRWSTIFIHICE